MTKKMLQKTSVNKLYEDIRSILEKAKSYAYKAVNFAMVTAYWQIGKVIVEEEQKGKERAEYGRFLIKELSKKLTQEFGEGFNVTNLKYMRQFYLKFPKFHALCGTSRKSHALRDESQKVNALRSELSWTHYRLLLKVEEEAARNFYMLECVENNWSTRELERQINTLLYERLVLSKGNKKVKELAKK